MAKKKAGVEKVSIRPGVQMLSVLSRLNYKPWFALAEFIDNSIQSYLDNRQALQKIAGKKFKLKVEIDYDNRDGGKLVVRDNAFGIRPKEFPRAFRPAEVPADTSGLHEYGMGMKSAACWFSPRWEVRTSNPGSSIAKSVKFNIEKIVEDKIDELQVNEETVGKETHFTEIILRDLHQPLHGKTFSKIRSHLGSIFRRFIDKGFLEIYFDGKPIEYNQPKILKAPFFKSKSGPSKIWRKKVEVSLGGKKRAFGFIAIRETGSGSEAGIALFKKDRLIQGSFDEAWRPRELFGPPNKYRYQRLFGELSLVGFEVSHTKDGFMLSDQENILIEKLKKELSRSSLDILAMAEGYRARVKSDAIKKPVKKMFQKLDENFDKKLDQLKSRSEKAAKKKVNSPPKSLRSNQSSSTETLKNSYNLSFRDEDWVLEVIFQAVSSSQDLIDFSDHKAKGSDQRKISLRINTNSVFYQMYVGTNAESIDLIARVGIALAVSETLARDGGVRKAGLVREIMNDILKSILSR